MYNVRGDKIAGTKTKARRTKVETCKNSVTIIGAGRDKGIREEKV